MSESWICAAIKLYACLAVAGIGPTPYLGDESAGEVSPDITNRQCDQTRQRYRRYVMAFSCTRDTTPPSTARRAPLKLILAASTTGAISSERTLVAMAPPSGFSCAEDTTPASTIRWVSRARAPTVSMLKRRVWAGPAPRGSVPA